MKAVANGVIHTSVMDGWWHEAYAPGLGWAVGRNRIEDDPEVQNAFDSEAIYDLLEFEIAPLFYARDHDGIPGGWINLMKRSIGAFAPVFNTDRMVMEYASEAYRPAASAWHALTAANLAGAREMVQWEKRVRASWPQVSVAHVGDSTLDGMADGNGVAVTAVVELGALSASDVLVDLAAGPVLPSGEIAIERTVPLRAAENGGGPTTFSGTVELERSGRAGYAVRVLPNHPMLRDPLSLGLVRWSHPAG